MSSSLGVRETGEDGYKVIKGLLIHCSEVGLEVYSGHLVEQGEVLVSVLLPTITSSSKLCYYRQGRRRAGDLAVANLAVMAGEEGLRILVGGWGGVVGATPPPVVEARRTAALLTTRPGASRGEVAAAVVADLGPRTTKWRAALAVAFLEAWRRGEEVDGVRYGEMEGSQVWEQVGEEQSREDPVHRPLPHEAGKEQLQGAALYVDDLPYHTREVGLYPVLSTEAHAALERVELAAVLQVPGVVAWIAATDVPGTNLWAIGGVPDEEVFPSTEVVHVGQIIGLVAAENREAGLEGAR